ncbi:MAG: glyoxalase [Pseudonocardiales bacterium]|nr:MAG: glyoxalase [Pseudonocardiales bacterium]
MCVSVDAPSPDALGAARTGPSVETAAGVLRNAAAYLRPVDYEAARIGLLHHVELWVPDLGAARPRWQWLLGSLGYEQFQSWDNGVSYRLGPTYIVLEQSPALIGGSHERRRAGRNHLAFHAGSRADLDLLVHDARGRGWNLMFQDRHPFAGGPDSYAAYLEDDDGYEVELVAD